MASSAHNAWNIIENNPRPVIGQDIPNVYLEDENRFNYDQNPHFRTQDADRFTFPFPTKLRSEYGNRLEDIGNITYSQQHWWIDTQESSVGISSELSVPSLRLQATDPYGVPLQSAELDPGILAAGEGKVVNVLNPYLEDGDPTYGKGPKNGGGGGGGNGSPPPGGGGGGIIDLNRVPPPKPPVEETPGPAEPPVGIFDEDFVPASPEAIFERSPIDVITGRPGPPPAPPGGGAIRIEDIIEVSPTVIEEQQNELDIWEQKNDLDSKSDDDLIPENFTHNNPPPPPPPGRTTTGITVTISPPGTPVEGSPMSVDKQDIYDVTGGAPPPPPEGGGGKIAVGKVPVSPPVPDLPGDIGNEWWRWWNIIHTSGNVYGDLINEIGKMKEKGLVPKDVRVEDYLTKHYQENPIDLANTMLQMLDYQEQTLMGMYGVNDPIAESVRHIKEKGLLWTNYLGSLQRIHQLTQSLQEKESKYEQYIAELKHGYEIARQRENAQATNVYANDLKVYTDELTKTTSQLQRLKGMEDMYKTELTEKNAAYQSLYTNYAQLLREYQKVKADYGASSEEANRLKADLVKVQSDMEIMKNSYMKFVNEVNTENKTLQRQYETEKHERAKVEQSYKEFADKALSSEHALQYRITELENEIREAVGYSTKARQEIIILKSSLESTQNQLEEAKKQLELSIYNHTQDTVALRATVDYLKSEMNNLQNQLQQSNAELLYVTREKNEYSLNYHKLLTQVRSHEQNRNQVLQDFKDLMIIFEEVFKGQDPQITVEKANAKIQSAKDMDPTLANGLLLFTSDNFTAEHFAQIANYNGQFLFGYVQEFLHRPPSQSTEMILRSINKYAKALNIESFWDDDYSSKTAMEVEQKMDPLNYSLSAAPVFSTAPLVASTVDLNTVSPSISSVAVAGDIANEMEEKAIPTKSNPLNMITPFNFAQAIEHMKIPMGKKGKDWGSIGEPSITGEYDFYAENDDQTQYSFDTSTNGSAT